MLEVNLSNKNVVVTGAGYGLGRAIAIGFSRFGANLILAARNESKLNETKQMLKDPSNADLLPLDLSNTPQIQKKAEKIKSHFPALDILVNNAAGWHTGTLEEMRDEDIASQITTTITGNLLLTKHLLPALEKSSHGHIVNVLSTTALPDKRIDPSSASVAFYASKWGQAGFSEALRGEVEKKGIKVISIYPGSFATESSIDDKPEDIQRKYRKNIMGVRDVVEAILFSVTRSPIASANSMTIMETHF